VILHALVLFSHTSVILTRMEVNMILTSVITTRFFVIYKRSSVMYTHKVRLPHAECDLYTQCDFARHECDFNTHKSDIYTQNSFLHPQSVSLHAYIQIAISRRRV
jgi:hypothetical protein